jgi:hypothetical protein
MLILVANRIHTHMRVNFMEVRVEVIIVVGAPLGLGALAGKKLVFTGTSLARDDAFSEGHARNLLKTQEWLFNEHRWQNSNIRLIIKLIEENLLLKIRPKTFTSVATLYTSSRLAVCCRSFSKATMSSQEIQRSWPPPNIWTLKQTARRAIPMATRRPGVGEALQNIRG